MTTKKKENPACAVCTYRKRICRPDCPMLRYFPGSDLRRFLIVHQLFGHSNVYKWLRALKTLKEKDEMMRCIQYEAEMRDRDRVRGVTGLLSDLKNKVSIQNEENEIINNYLNYYRSLAAAQGGTGHYMPLCNPPFSIEGSSCVGGGIHVAQGPWDSWGGQNPNPGNSTHVASFGGESGSWGGQNTNSAGIHVAPPSGFFVGGESGFRGGQNPNLVRTRVAPSGIFIAGESGSRGGQNPNPVRTHVAPPSRTFVGGESGSRGGQNPNPVRTHVAPPSGTFVGGESGSRGGQNPNLVRTHVAPPSGTFVGGESGFRGGQNPNLVRTHVAPPSGVFIGGESGSRGGQNPNVVRTHAAPSGIFVGRQNASPGGIHVGPSGTFLGGESSSQGGRNPNPVGIQLDPSGIEISSWDSQNPNPSGTSLSGGSGSWVGQNRNADCAYAAPPAGGCQGGQNPNPNPNPANAYEASSSRGGVLTTGVAVPTGNVPSLMEIYIAGCRPRTGARDGQNAAQSGAQPADSYGDDGPEATQSD